jgi:serine-type D-Ala-D-Ala carboxypeptidase/endopeptidase (penicillin-binding protein 4)
VLKNGSGLNDTNRFTARQLATLLQAVWRRFPVASEFVSSLGIAARDGTMRLRMEGTDAAGRLRAKTGTLERVTALSGYVQSLGGERFVFSVLVNDWAGKSAPVISSIDRLGGLLAALGAPESGVREAAAALAAAVSPQDAQPAELKARIATYAALASAADKKNLPFLRSALRTERDPMLRIVLADAIYRSDPDQGGGVLLEAIPPSPELFVRLRSVGRELALPIPAVSSLLDLAVDGSAEALARLFSLAPLARGAGRDEQLAALLSDGLLEVGDASPDEMFSGLRAAPASQAQAAIELASTGLEQAGTDPAKYPLAQVLRRALPEGAPPSPQLDGWLAVLERRPARPAEPVVQSAPGTAGTAGSPVAPATAPAPATGPAPGTGPAKPAVVPAPLPEPTGRQTVPAAAHANPAVLVTPPADGKPGTAICTSQSPACPGGG